MKDPTRDPLNPTDVVGLVAGRRDLGKARPLSDLAGVFRQVPTPLERWNAVPGAVRLVESAPSRDAVPVVVAEQVDGTLLSEIIRQAGVLDMTRAVRLALGLGQTLESLHNAGFVHRDLRADNVLVVGDDEQVLIHPPLRLLSGSADPPDPMSHVSEREDLRAFGVILYQLLAGVGPHQLGSREIVLVATSPVPLRKRRRGIPPPLERLVMEMLTPHRRQLDVSDVVNWLWVERERLRGRGPRDSAGTGQYRRLVAVAAMATFVTIGGLSASRLPAPPGARPDLSPAPAVTPPLIATRPESAPTAREPSVEEPRSSPPPAWPALPPRTIDREAPESAAAPKSVAAARPRAPADDSTSVSAPRSATSGLIARREAADGTAVIEPPPPVPSPPPAWPALPPRTMDREAPESAAAPKSVDAARPRAPAGDSTNASAPRSATSGLIPRRETADEPAVIDPPAPMPAPTGIGRPVGTPPESSRTAAAPSIPAVSKPGPRVADDRGGSPSPQAAAPGLAARQQSGDLGVALEPAPVPSTPREADMSGGGALALAPKGETAATRPSMPTDTDVAGPVMLVRGAPGPGFEAGPSALSTGYGASGAAGMVEGRLGPVLRDLRSNERPPRSGVASAAGFPAAAAGQFSNEPDDGRFRR